MTHYQRVTARRTDTEQTDTLHMAKSPSSIHVAQRDKKVSKSLRNTMTVFTGINDDVCSYYPGDSRHAELFWIGGQRVDLSYASNFVWKKTPGCSDRDCVSELTYTHWEQGEPNNRGDFIGNYERTSPTVPEKCMQFRSNRDYTWNDGSCELAACSICEIDL